MLMLLGVACGNAASPDAAPADTGGSQASNAVPTSMAQPAEGSSDTMVNPGKLIVMVGGWGGRFAPLYNSGCHAFGINHGGFLIRSDENRQYIPGLATDWEVSDDGLTWTFTIRDDALFHDGTPVTAADWEFTALQNWGPGALEVATSATAIAASKNVAKIELTAPNQVSITHVKVDSGFPNLMSDATGSCHGLVLPKHFWDGFEIHDQDRAVAYDQNPIAAGPLKMLKILPDELMAFERFDDYYDEERSIKIQNVDLFKVPDLATRAAALEAGDADIAPISLDTAGRVEASGGRVIWGPEASYFRTQLLGAWLPEYPFSHKKVRQAMQYALDMSQFTALYGEEVFQPKGFIYATPSSIGYSPGLDAYPYDPEKAKALMAEAGFPNGEGFGKLIVNTWQSQGVPFMPESAELAASQWRTVLGIDAEVRVGDEVAIKQAANSSDTIYGQMVWRDNETRVDGVSITRSSFGDPTNKGRSHEDPAIFDAAVKAMAVIPPQEKEEALRDLYLLLREESYRFSIGYVNIPWGVSSRVAEWTPQPMAFYPSALHTVRLK
jgi:peptide/nickel transport system substrate-binding protein